jgi:hypothetical protein
MGQGWGYLKSRKRELGHPAGIQCSEIGRVHSSNCYFAVI